MLYAPLVEVGDEITGIGQLTHLPNGTILIDRLGHAAQSWIDGDESHHWGITAYGDTSDPDELLRRLAHPITVLHLPKES